MDDWCATTSEQRDEPLTATASRVERWLLVEHTGAWGPESVPLSRLAVESARAIGAAARQAGARLLVIRRHHEPGTAQAQVDDGLRQVYAVDSRPGSERVLGKRVGPDELAELVPPYGVPEAEGWTAEPGPLLLVCTHGRHDRCCAVRGRPVAHALWGAWPDAVWECSHVGGDRFAANVIVLPEGLYLGRVGEDEAVDVVRGIEAGTLPPGRLRGRSSLPLPTQAAQEFAREQLGRWGRDDLAAVHQEHAGPDRWRVRLGGAPQVDVVVRYDRSGDGTAHVLTCGAGEAKTAALFRLVQLDVLSSV